MLVSSRKPEPSLEMAESLDVDLTPAVLLRRDYNNADGEWNEPAAYPSGRRQQQLCVRWHGDPRACAAQHEIALSPKRRSLDRQDALAKWGEEPLAAVF